MTFAPTKPDARLRAISLWQPWASLIAMGEKHFETRSWATPYRGLLAIHAAKQWGIGERNAFDWFNRDMPDLQTRWPHSDHPARPLPLGAVLFVFRLVDVMRTDEIATLSYRELAFGDYTPGRFAWQLEMVEVFEQPIPAKGAQSLWWWERSTL